MASIILLFMVLWGVGKLMQSAPKAVKFGLDNREALHGGMGMLKRMFSK